MARLFFTLEFLIKSITIPTFMFRKVESDFFWKHVSPFHWRIEECCWRCGLRNGLSSTWSSGSVFWLVGIGIFKKLNCCKPCTKQSFAHAHTRRQNNSGFGRKTSFQLFGMWIGIHRKSGIRAGETPGEPLSKRRADLSWMRRDSCPLVRLIPGASEWLGIREAMPLSPERWSADWRNWRTGKDVNSPFSRKASR